MLHQFSRCELAFGPEGLEKMKNSTVAVLGVGGVGSFTVEALARTGVGKLVLVDKDVVDITNINRQIHANLQTIGRSKTELMKERVALINPECEVVTLDMFYSAETADQLFAYKLDYLVDAMDVVSAKIHLILEAKKRNIPIVASMGAANKMDPTRFEVVDISRTSYDPIAKVIRRELRKERIYKGVKVVYSKEIPVTIRGDVQEQIVADPNSPIRKVRQPPASNAFVPSVAGLILASVVVRDIVDWQPVTG